MDNATIKEMMTEQLWDQGFELAPGECYTILEWSGRTQKVVSYRRDGLMVQFVEDIPQEEDIPFNHGLMELTEE